MRTLAIVLFTSAAVWAQTSGDAADSVSEAISAANELSAAGAQSFDPIVIEAARRAYFALSNVAEVLSNSPYYRAPVAMDPVTWRIFLEDLRRGTSGDQHRKIVRAARRHLFTVDQLVVMMELFVMGDDRIRVALTLYNRLLDPENFDRAYAALSFDSDRRRLALLVSR
jgi:hypothetical protein